MTVLTEATKAKKVTEAMFQLATEYTCSGDRDEKVCASILTKACLDLPDYSKARLFDILTK